MNLLTIDDISQMIKLSRVYTRNVVVKKAGFPAPVVGVRKPRWDEDCICEDAVYPVDADDGRTSMPVFLSRELLELAAKASGIEVRFCDNVGPRKPACLPWDWRATKGKP